MSGVSCGELNEQSELELDPLFREVGRNPILLRYWYKNIMSGYSSRNDGRADQVREEIFRRAVKSGIAPDDLLPRLPEDRHQLLDRIAQLGVREREMVCEASRVGYAGYLKAIRIIELGILELAGTADHDYVARRLEVALWRNGIKRRFTDVGVRMNGMGAE